MSGSMTWYNNSGFGACGQAINPSSQFLVAVSSAWWTTANPNDDPLCQGISVQVTYNGATITVPVEDKCPTCSASHIDLSEPAFAQLAPLSDGIVSGITWEFVSSGSGGCSGCSPTQAAAAQATTAPPSAPPSQGGSCAPAWNPGTSYTPGQVVSYNGQNWTATFYSTDAVPDDPASWAVWTAAGACS